MKLQDYLAANELAIQSVGTSEGASKGWDSRGRGRMTDQDTRAFRKATGRHPDAHEQKNIENSVPHRKFMQTLVKRVPKNWQEDDSKNYTHTRTPEEHAMAKQLQSTGHLKAIGKDASGNRKWNVTAKGHVGFDLDQY